MSTFQAIAWDGQDTDDQFTIRIFGRSADGQSVSLGTPFQPYCYVKPQRYSAEVLSFVKSKCWKAEHKRAKDLWGFQNGELSNFIQVTFKTHRALRSFAYSVENAKWPELSGARMYEANIDPVLRFMHCSGCSSTGWIDPGLCEPDIKTTCDVNLWAPNWRFITPVQRDDVAPLRIMSFDIECYSSTGAFPDPRNPQDVVFQIGMTTKEFGKDEWFDRKCLCLKTSTGPDLESFETERDLLNAFAKYLVKVDPDIITGWNIFGFDLEFLHFRAVLRGASTEWGRVKDVPCDLVEKNLASSALGNNLLKMVPMTGRYVFDLFQDVKREHKLESYSLNNVSKHFLKDQKNDMPVKEIFGRYAEGDPQKLGEVAAYCLKDTELPHALLAKLCQVQNVIEMAKACWVPLSFLSERGQQIKVFSQMAKKARELGFVIPTFRISSKCIRDCPGTIDTGKCRICNRPPCAPSVESETHLVVCVQTVMSIKARLSSRHRRVRTTAQSLRSTLRPCTRPSCARITCAFRRWSWIPSSITWRGSSTSSLGHTGLRSREVTARPSLPFSQPS
jgi:DNA polymerase delta subunit 1